MCNLSPSDSAGCENRLPFLNPEMHQSSQRLQAWGRGIGKQAQLVAKASRVTLRAFSTKLSSAQPERERFYIELLRGRSPRWSGREGGVGAA